MTDREIGIKMLSEIKEFDTECKNEIKFFDHLVNNLQVVSLMEKDRTYLTEIVNTVRGVVGFKVADTLFSRDFVECRLKDPDNVLKSVFRFPYESVKKKEILLCTSYNGDPKKLCLGDASEKDYEDFSQVCGSAAIKFFLLYSWRKWKKIYAFDDDFIDELLCTDSSDLNIPVNRFPYPCFYVSANILQNIDGFYVVKTGFKNEEEDFYIVYYDKAINSYEAIFANMVEGDIINIADIDNTSSEAIRNNIDEGHAIHEDLKDTLTKDEIVQYYSGITHRIFTVLAYIFSEEADISDSARVKLNRNSSKKDKSKTKKDPYTADVFSVGVTIGKALKLSKTEASGMGISSDDTVHRESGPVSPHVRKAHWHHYWTGSKKNGTKSLTLKWVAPSYVNGYTPDTQIAGVTPVER